MFIIRPWQVWKPASFAFLMSPAADVETDSDSRACARRSASLLKSLAVQRTVTSKAALLQTVVVKIRKYAASLQRHSERRTPRLTPSCSSFSMASNSSASTSSTCCCCTSWLALHQAVINKLQVMRTNMGLTLDCLDMMPIKLQYGRAARGHRCVNERSSASIRQDIRQVHE